MKRRIGLMVGAAFCAVALAAGVLYYEIQPLNHFRTPPVLSMPSNQVSIAASPSITSTANQSSPLTSAQSASQPRLVEGRGTFNVLLLGVDARAPNQPARTDTIVVIHVDLVHHRYDVLSIPRDLRVDVPPYGETKITHANYMGELSGGLKQGTTDVIQAVSNLTGLTINYYAETNYWGLRGIVDALGGIEMNVPFPVYMDATWYHQDADKTVPAGQQFLTGMVVSDLVHQRHYVPGGDFGRQRLQEEALIGIAHRILSPMGMSRLPKFVSALSSFLVTTNVSKSDMVSMALAMRGFHSNEVHYFQVPGHPWQGKDPIVGTVLDYWVANTPQLEQILKSNFQ